MNKFKNWLDSETVTLLPWQESVAAQIVDRGMASGKRFLVRLLADFYGITARAVQEERERCLRIVARTQPDNSGIHGMALQTRSGHDWIVAAKQAISKAIAEGGA